jgi:hypothetical protein
MMNTAMARGMTIGNLVKIIEEGPPLRAFLLIHMYPVDPDCEGSASIF